MNHNICGVCTADLSRDHSCGLLLKYKTIEEGKEKFITLYTHGYMDGDPFNHRIFCPTECYHYDTTYLKVHPICLSCGRVTLESFYFYCFRIPLNEIPLLISNNSNFCSQRILRYKLENNIETIKPLDEGRLTYFDYQEIKSKIFNILFENHLINNEFFKIIDGEARSEYLG